MREVARRFGVSLSHVQRWVSRAEGHRLDRVDWSDDPDGQRRAHNRTPTAMEDLILAVRRELKETSDLGEFGAVAIHQELRDRRARDVPCVRTIGRILERRGVLDRRRRQRWPAPPRGWYLPDVAAAAAELDSFDFVEGLVIRDGPQVEVLNGTSLHGGLIGSWPMAPARAKTVVQALIEHWRAWGLPHYAQFDNDTRFHGPHHHQDTVGRVIRLCLSLGVVPTFAPPQETGFQAAVENLNGRWQAKVWSRFQHESLAALCERSARYVVASRRRAVARLAAAPPRPPFPECWKLDLQRTPAGRIVYLRRTDDHGRVTFLGRTFPVDAHWPHRLVRCIVDLDGHMIHFHALRRRAPHEQPLLHTLPYTFPRRPFHD